MGEKRPFYPILQSTTPAVFRRASRAVIAKPRPLLLHHPPSLPACCCLAGSSGFVVRTPATPTGVHRILICLGWSVPAGQQRDLIPSGVVNSAAGEQVCDSKFRRLRCRVERQISGLFHLLISLWNFVRTSSRVLHSRLLGIC